MKKITTTELILDFESVLAGIMIALGSVVYCKCLPDKILGSFLFSLGLLTVIAQDYKLYTGKIGYVKWQKESIFNLIRILIGNVIGVWILTKIMSYTRIYPEIMENANMLMAGKAEDSLLSLFILGIGCGIMMFLAVDNYRIQDRKPIYVILPIMFFILCGFEHCIADAGYFFLSDVQMSLDMLYRFLVIVCGNTVGSVIFYRLSRIYKFKFSH